MLSYLVTSLGGELYHQPLTNAFPNGGMAGVPRHTIGYCLETVIGRVVTRFDFEQGEGTFRSVHASDTVEGAGVALYRVEDSRLDDLDEDTRINKEVLPSVDVADETGSPCLLFE